MFQTDIEVGVQILEDQQKLSSDLESLINQSQLSQNKHELLGHYLRFEQYFMEESVSKAVAMDAIDQEQNSSSMVDDTFFIVRKCIRYMVFKL